MGWFGSFLVSDRGFESLAALFANPVTLQKKFINKKVFWEGGHGGGMRHSGYPWKTGVIHHFSAFTLWTFSDLLREYVGKPDSCRTSIFVASSIIDFMYIQAYYILFHSSNCYSKYVDTNIEAVVILYEF